MILKQSSSTLVSVVCIILLLFFISGCAEKIPGSNPDDEQARSVRWQASENAVTQRNFNLFTAEWGASSNTLNLVGASNKRGERVIIQNPDSGKIIASTVADNNLAWSIAIRSLTSAPCRIKVVSESGTLQTRVSGAGKNCTALSSISTFDKNPENNTLPNARITSPQTDRSILINEFVKFEADASNIIGVPSFKWNFNGAANNGSIQNPGELQFTRAGVYQITLDVSDSRGASDPTPPMRMITVLDPDAILTTGPIANIDTPVGNQSIQVGDILNFSGSGNDPASNEVVTYLWNFAGVAPNGTVKNPGDVTFTTPGIFSIVLWVSDSVGNLGSSQLTVTVVDPMTNQPPTATIISPPNDIILNPGDSILIEGQATDPDPNDTVSYLWEFDGVAENSAIQNPGSMTYPNIGTYTIRLVATDNFGLVDPNPPVRVVTVQAASPITNDAPNGNILTPTMDTTIMAGESIIFTGMGTVAAGKEPLIYLWSFDGVADNSAMMDAGSIMFPNPGVYVVTFVVFDTTFQMDPTPAVRIVTVQDPNAMGDPTVPPTMPPTVPAMINHIVTPETDMTILVGNAVNFTGLVTPENNPPYTYLWLFDGAAKNVLNLSPGDVMFSDPGIYNVMFFAIDKDGIFDSSPAVRTITATDSTAQPNVGPISMIINPDGDMSLNTGDSISFEGSVIDVSGNGTLSYLWTFGGAARDSTLLNPASVTFDVPGEYEIAFSATDTSTMLGSTQPAVVVITVSDPVSAPPINTNAPIVEILNPGQNTVIMAGESIDFAGSVVDVSGNGTLEFLWTYDDMAPDSNGLNPGSVVFDTPGQFNIIFTAVDVMDPTGMTMGSTSVSVTVMPAMGNTTPANLPDSIILEPAADQTINVGDSLQFNGEGTNPANNGKLNFEWDFDNGLASTSQVPGSVTFSQVGVFSVTLTVSHGNVHTDPSPAEVIITVVDGGAN